MFVLFFRRRLGLYAATASSSNSESKFALRFMYFRKQAATNSAKVTGTALPMSCSKSVFLPSQTKFSGNVWTCALSIEVNARTEPLIGEASFRWGLYPGGIGLLVPRLVRLGSSIL